MENEVVEKPDSIEYIKEQCNLFLNNYNLFTTIFCELTKSFKTLDDFLNLKFDLVKSIFQKQTKQDYLSKYKVFFEPGDMKALEENKKIINDIFLPLLNKEEKIEYRMFCWLQLSYAFDAQFDAIQKIDVSDIENDLKQCKEVKVQLNHDFIKICKAVYNLYNGKLSEQEIPQYSLMFCNLANNLFKSPEAAKMVLKNIQKIECDDEKFKGFQNQLKDWVFDVEEFVANNNFVESLEDENVNNKNLSSLYPRNSHFSQTSLLDTKTKTKAFVRDFVTNEKVNKSENKISVMKLFVLIATVIFLAAVIFFAINLILEFLAITQMLATILIVLATIVFSIFLAISIENNVINNSTCFGGKKSFIDLYQDEENKKQVPEQNRNSDLMEKIDHI